MTRTRGNLNYILYDQQQQTTQRKVVVGDRYHYWEDIEKVNVNLIISWCVKLHLYKLRWTMTLASQQSRIHHGCYCALGY